MQLEVLYEDNHLIAVYKPAGVLVQKGDDPSVGGGHDDDTLYWQVKTFIKKRDKKLGNVFLGVLHRLDRPVSGIVLFAKTSKGAARLSEQFRNRTVKKIYHVMVEGKPDHFSGTLTHKLLKNNETKKAEISEGGENAELHYATVKRGKKNSLLKIELKTGRFHQIRAQLAAVGHPILGDIKYGSRRSFIKEGIALMATELVFQTATGEKENNIKINFPEEWNKLL